MTLCNRDNKVNKNDNSTLLSSIYSYSSHRVYSLLGKSLVSSKDDKV